MVNCFITNSDQAMIPIKPMTKAIFAGWIERQDVYLKNWLRVNRFNAESGSYCLVADQQGQLAMVLMGVDSADDFWVFGDLPARLPEGNYRIDLIEPLWSDPRQWQRAAIAWGLGSYNFNRYHKKNHKAETANRRLFIPETEPELCQTTVESIYWIRDLINTPTEDMNPQALAGAAVELAKSFGCTARVIQGDELLTAHFPTIHAVGRSSPHPPCLVDFQWGDHNNPLITLVGKGVCFDSGGLNIKSPEGMRIMKKDMGGAAHALGLARMIMSQALPVRLRVLIPIAENAISGNSYHPGDIIITRAGITVEIGNTDAEGRLLLCDALAAAAEETPDLIVDFATLTGGARVALGPEIAAFFCNQDRLAQDILKAGEQSRDLLWRLPLHAAYERYLKSDFADICNASAGPFAGAITAALYLKQFVPNKLPWAHFDISAWNFDKLPGRPIGGEAHALRAVYTYLRDHYRP